jgi:hypothetical protein
MVKSLDGFTASLLLKLVEFQPDPQAAEKRMQREENERWTPPLNPHPPFDDWEYHKLLMKGVRPLADSKPYETARVLIDAVASMIRLRVYDLADGQQERNDLSEIWCRRVREPSGRFLRPEEDLVHTLTHACESVYQKSPESVVGLNEALRNQPWRLFKRIREHLYSLYPNDQTKDWIRELIITYQHYAEREYGFEFQRMVRSSCEKFGTSLLTEPERATIFEAILAGPSQAEYREWLGEQYTDDAFEQRRRFFQLKQLTPFASVLFGKYADYFRQLETARAARIGDDDYSPVSEIRGGTVTQRSPITKEELAARTDEEILKLINEWQESARSSDDWLVEISIGALAHEFGSLFRNTIIADQRRLDFWMQHLRQIERPIYVRAIVEVAQEVVKSRTFDKLDAWFDVCEWILSHAEVESSEADRTTDESREKPQWDSARRAVADFIETCVQNEVSVPLTVRPRIALFLQKLCTEFDSRLDSDRPVLLNRDDQLTEAINNTRSRALEILLDFGYWVRRESREPDAVIPEVGNTLGKRLELVPNYPLTLPEYAILGAQFTRIWDLHKKWATDHKPVLFPLPEVRPWTEAFGNFLRYSRPFRPMFDLFKPDIEFALENLRRVKETSSFYPQLADTLAEHLFTYYLWDVYPLTGNESLLEAFYLKTTGDKERWASLFDYVGRSLKNTGRDLANDLKERIIDFFEWRLSEREPTELKQFTFWLEAEALEPEWRVKAFSRVLDITEPDFAISLHIDALVEMLKQHTSAVLACFAKLTARLKREDSFYIQADQAKAILQAGFASQDKVARENAERARENLLRAERFDLLEIGAQ